jgi:hypothetical protein
MFTAYVIVTVLTAAANTYAAIVDFRRPQWVLDNMTKWGGSQLVAVRAGRPQGRRHTWITGGYRRSCDRRGSRGWPGPVFRWCYYCCGSCSLVLTSSMACNLSAAGHWSPGVAACSVVKTLNGDDVDLVGCSKIF